MYAEINKKKKKRKRDQSLICLILQTYNHRSCFHQSGQVCMFISRDFQHNIKLLLVLSSHGNTLTKVWPALTKVWPALTKVWLAFILFTYRCTLLLLCRGSLHMSWKQNQDHDTSNPHTHTHTLGWIKCLPTHAGSLLQVLDSFVYMPIARCFRISA